VTKQLSILGDSPAPAVDRVRPALTVKPRRQTRELPTIGFLPILEDEFRPAIRSKRVKVSAPRMLRTGDRPQSLGTATLTREERLFKRLDEWNVEGETYGPPKTFGECPPTGPCPHFGCRHHAGLEVDADIVKLNWPNRDVDEIPETCTLRIANAGERKNGNKGELGNPVMSCEEVAAVLNVTCERARQLEAEAKAKFKRRLLRLMPELEDL